MAWAWAMFLGGAIGLTPSRATAGQSARLVYSRTAEAASCGDEHAIRQAVARRLGYDPFVAASMNTVVAELRGDGDGLKARVYVIREGNSAGGSRELSSPTRACTELLAAVALAISIAVDPDALDRIEQAPATDAESANGPENQPEASTSEQPRRSEPEPPPAPSAATTTGKSPTVLPPAVPVGSSSVEHPPVSFSVGAAATLANGPTPSPTVGLGLQAMARIGNWAIALEPEGTLRSSQAKASVGSVSVVALGGNLSSGHFFGPLYAGVLFDAVVLNAKGDGVAKPNNSNPLLASLGMRLSYALRLSDNLSLVPRAEGLVALKPVEMRLNGSEVFTTPRVIVRGGLGVNYRF